MYLNGFQKGLLAWFCGLLIYWIILHATHHIGGLYNYLYSLLFSLTPLVGGFIGIFKAKLWGGLKSRIGKSVFFLSFGLFLWGAGSMVWSYYNLVLHNALPYPSWADLGFAPSVFFYGLGAIYLSGATGAKFGWRNTYAKFFAILAPIIILIGSYYILVVVARGGVLVPPGETWLKTVLDIAYPLGDFLSLTLAIVISGLSFPYLGGKYLPDIISILIGLAMMYVADSVFSYTTTVGTFYDGDFGDLLLTFGLFFLTFGALGFCALKARNASSPPTSP